LNRARIQRFLHSLKRKSLTPVLDPDFGLGLSKVDPLHSNAIAREFGTSPFVSPVPIEFDFESERNRLSLAIEACHDKLGVWPISFSAPTLFGGADANKVRTISEVVPGSPYSYDHYDEYIKQYAESAIAITHRKAGWDCFRHIEILAAGSLPYMLDVAGIPAHCMVHYPLNLMKSLTEILDSGAGLPVVSNPLPLQSYVERSLTSESMAKYVLRVSGLQNATRVLFVDANLGQMADYLSLFTLIGFKQLLGSDCSVLMPVPYVYSDWGGDSSTLYGRGFGYTRILEPSVRNENESQAEQVALDSVSEITFDAVVIGNITRNSELARELLLRFPAEKTIWIHGEDTPPLLPETEFLLNSGTHVFVRAIH
jgi:hypothetical protein